MVGNIEAVFHKVGRKGQHFLAGIDDGLEQGVQGRGSACRKQNVVCGKLDALFCGEPFGKGLPGPGGAGIGRIAKGKGLVGLVHKGLQAVHNLFWSGKIWVAQGKVVHILGAVFFLELNACLEHAADERRVRDIALNGLGKQFHMFLSALLSLAQAGERAQPP